MHLSASSCAVLKALCACACALARTNAAAAADRQHLISASRNHLVDDAVAVLDSHHRGGEERNQLLLSSGLAEDLRLREGQRPSGLDDAASRNETFARGGRDK